MNDHSPAVAAVYDRRQTLIANGVTAVAPGGLASPKTMAILAEAQYFLSTIPPNHSSVLKIRAKPHLLPTR
jgi:hypothetical protein